MRISTLKTPAAVLRAVIEMKIDDDFLAIVGCSADLWKKIENGSRQLTASRAARIESATGASRFWLLSGKPLPAITIHGEPFTAKSFRAHRAGLLKNEEDKPVGVAVWPGGYWPELMGIAQSATERGMLASFAIDLGDAVAKLKRQYGAHLPTFHEAVSHAQKTPEAFAPFVSEGVSDKNRRWHFENAVGLIAGGTLPTVAHHKRMEVAHLPAEMRPDAELEVVESVERPSPKTKITTWEIRARNQTRKK